MAGLRAAAAVAAGCAVGMALAAPPAAAASDGYAWVGIARLGTSPGSGVVNDVWSSRSEAEAGVATNDVWVATDDGIYRMRDGGAPAPAGLQGQRVTQVAARVVEPAEIYAALSDGIYVSTDGGASFGSSPALAASSVRDIDVIGRGSYSESAAAATSSGLAGRTGGGGWEVLFGVDAHAWCGTENPGDQTTTLGIGRDTRVDLVSFSQGQPVVVAGHATGQAVHLLECESAGTLRTVSASAYTDGGIFSTSDGGFTWSGPAGLQGVRWRLDGDGGSPLYVTAEAVHDGRAADAATLTRGLPPGVTINSARTDRRPDGSTRDYLATDAGLFWRVLDTTRPAATISAPRRTFQTTGSVTVGWRGSDDGTGVEAFDVRRRSASHSAGFGPFRRLRSATDAASATITARSGTTQCFSVRAHDRAGNTSAWSAERCTAIPLDQGAMTAGDGWVRKASRGYLGGAALRTDDRGATLWLDDVRTRRVSLLAVGCPSCGTVQVRLAGSRVGSIDLRSETRVRRHFSLPAFAALRSGRLELVVVSAGKQVTIDGVALSRA